jgi:hypothetical protein
MHVFLPRIDFELETYNSDIMKLIAFQNCICQIYFCMSLVTKDMEEGTLNINYVIKFPLLSLFAAYSFSVYIYINIKGMLRVLQ